MICSNLLSLSAINRIHTYRSKREAIYKVHTLKMGGEARLQGEKCLNASLVFCLFVCLFFFHISKPQAGQFSKAFNSSLLPSRPGIWITLPLPHSLPHHAAHSTLLHGPVHLSGSYFNLCRSLNSETLNLSRVAALPHVTNFSLPPFLLTSEKGDPPQGVLGLCLASHLALWGLLDGLPI